MKPRRAYRFARRLRGSCGAARAAWAIYAIGLLLAACSDDGTTTPAPAGDASPGIDAGDGGGPSLPVTLAGEPRPVTSTFFGLNGNNRQGPSWSDAEFIAAVMGLGPGHLRFPAGTDANYWDWEAGWYYPSYGIDLIPSAVRTLEAFQPMVAATGAAPIFVLNVLTWQNALAEDGDQPAMVADQVDMLTHADQDLGLPVSFVELGNEFYFESPGEFSGEGPYDYEQVFADGEEYALKMAPWIEAVRSGFPAAEIAVVASSSGESGSRQASWNGELLLSPPAADAATLHFYIRQRDASASPEALLADMFDDWERLRENRIAPLAGAGFDVWLTEYNPVHDETQGLVFSSTWLQALSVSALNLMMLEEPAVTRASLHGVSGTSLWAAAVFAEEVAGAGVTIPALDRSASGLAMTEFGELLRDGRSAESLVLADDPGVAAGGHRQLFGVRVTDGAGRQQVLLLHLGATPLTLDLGAVVSPPFAYVTLHADDLMARVAESLDSYMRDEGNGSGPTLTVPPYSLTRIY